MKQFGNNLLRKCLAVFFAALMVFSILPMSALAEAFESLADEGTAEIGTLSKDDISKLKSGNGTKAAATYQKISATSVDDITMGNYYLITYTSGTSAYALSGTSSTASGYTSYLADVKLTVDSSGTITSGVTDDMLWRFAQSSSGNLLLRNKAGNYLTYTNDSYYYTAVSSTGGQPITYTNSSIKLASGSRGLYFYSAYVAWYTSADTLTLYEETITDTPVSAVELDTPVHAMAVGATKQLTAYVMPVGEADDTSVTWKSNNTSVATVSSSGLVTAKANGTATITVTTADGTYTDTCVVTVTSNPTKEVTYYERTFYAYPGAEYLIGASDSSNFYLMSGTAASSSSLSGTQTTLTTVGDILGTSDTTAAVAGSSAITNAYTWTVGADIAHGQYYDTIINKSTGRYLTHGTTSNATTSVSYVSLGTGTSTSGVSYWGYITLNDGNTAIYYYDNSVCYSVALSSGVFKAAAYSTTTVSPSEFYRKYTVTVEDTAATTYRYVLADTIIASEQYIIVAGGQGKAVSNNTVTNNHYLAPVSVTENSDDTLTVAGSVNVNEILWTAGGNADDGWTFQSVDDGKYMGLDSSQYLAPSTTAIAWLYSGNDLNNQVDTDGYYYLSYNVASTSIPHERFSTTKNTGNNIVFYQKVDAATTPTPTVAPTPTPTVAPTPTPTVPPVEEVVYYEPVSTVETGVEYLIGYKTTDGKVYLFMNYNPGPVANNYSNNYYASVSSNWYGYGIQATLDGENVVGVSNSVYADANIKNVEWFFVNQGSTYYIQSANDSNYYLYAYSTTEYVDCYPRITSTTLTEWEWNNSQLTSSDGKYVTFVSTEGSYTNLFSAPATATAESTLQLYAKRTVTTTEPTLVLDKTVIALSMKGDTTADITATVENLPEGATPTYTWAVEDDTVASVNGNGSVANITALQNGSTLLTCTVTFGDTTLTAEATIKVEDMMLVSISLDPQSVILSMDNPDVTAEVTATVITNPDGGVIGTDYDLVWTSSSPNFATVTPIDGTNKAKITPVAAGSTTITCVAVNKYDQTQTVRYTCNVVVKTAGQIPAPETGVGEEDTYSNGKVFVLVDYADIVKGKNYMILEGGSGNTYAIYDSGGYDLERNSITVQSGTAGVQGKYGKFVTSPSDTYIWYLTTSNYNGTLLVNNSGDYLYNDSGDAILYARSGDHINIVNVTGTPATTDVRILLSDYDSYLYYNSGYGFTSSSSNAKSFYFYEERVVPTGTTAVQSGVDIYCDGTRISQQEYKVQASSITTKTLEATPLNVPASATGKSATWSIYSQSSPDIVSIEDPSSGVVTFTGETGYAVVKVTYKYTYGGTTHTVTNYTKLVVETPEPESAEDTGTITTKIFQLVNKFEDGGTYIIVDNDDDALVPGTSGLSYTSSGSTYYEYYVTASGITVNAGGDGVSSVDYIVSDNTRIMWTYSTQSSGGKLTNVALGYKMARDYTDDSAIYAVAHSYYYLPMYYNSTNNRLYTISDDSKNYYIGGYSTSDVGGYASYSFTDSNAYTIRLFKEVEVTYTTTGKVGIDIYNGATCVSGTTVDVSGTSIQLSQQNNLFSSVTNETVTWEIVDSKIATVDHNGLVTITDTTGGEALVKVTLTWTGSDGTTKTATNYVTIRVASGDVIVDTGDTENFPEYPNEGSIRIEKNAYTAEGTDYYNTGVGTVELFARGVPMNSKPVDVVLVIDVSGSMEDGIYGGTANNNESSSQYNPEKMGLAKTAAKAFVEKLLKTATGYSDNRVAIVTFSTDANIITGTNTAAPTHNALIQVGSATELSSLNSVINGITATGGTNYDAALQYAYEILKSARSQPGYSREQFVVFLTDGAPGWYNQMELNSTTFPYSSYYTSSLISKISSLWYKWTTGVAPTASDWSGMTDPVETAFDDYKFTDHHYAAAIKARSFSALNMRQDVRSELGITSTLGATIYGISLGMAAGSEIRGFSIDSSNNLEFTSFTAAQCTALINRIVGSSDRVFAADNTAQLNEAFESIGSAILLAGTNAVVTDVIHPNFELQTADYGNITEYPNYTASVDSKKASIEVRKYTVGTDGNRTGAYETLERVTFNTDGTAAYSNVLGTSNILSYKEDGSYTITASLFTYESATKTFTWRIGDITANDMAIRYNVYLTDTRNTDEGQGARTGGRYDTNAQAYITYENHMGNRCKKVYEVPALPWASAIVTYRFYLVNANGQPVNSSGQLVDYQNLTYVTDEKKVDMTRTVTTTGEFKYDYALSAAALKAGISALNGYDLYDSAAAYTVNSNGRGGDQGTGKYIVTVGNGKVNTTVVRNAPGATPYAKPAGETNTAGDYTNTVVEFAVVWETKVIPDAVVIDYGLPVSIPVVNNDLVSDASGTLYGIYAGEANAANGSTDYTDSVSTATMGGSLRLTYGTASIVDATHIEYTPTSMSMNGVEEFYYEVSIKRGTEDKYLTTSIQVIPATTVYYEDNFTGSDGVTFTNGVGGQAQWQVVGSATATVQDTDYVGEGGNYGHDSHYEQGMTYSLSSAHKITVTQEHFDTMIANDELTWPTASFTFTGTGFDVVSLCNADSGIITVMVTDENDNRVTSFFVNTYYEGTQVIVDDDMYQIPVINCYDLDYGTYNVLITTPYVPILDSTNADGDGSYDLYIDGVRIYNPAQGNETATNAYIEDNEGYPVFKEMRDMLLTSVGYDPTDESIQFGGAMFVDGIAETAFASDYADFGPNNEIYLAPGQGIAFALRTTEAKPTGIYIGMKTPNGIATVAVDGNHTGASIRNTATLNTTSDMYYEIPAEALGEWTQDAVNNTWTSGYLVITNISPVDSGRVIALTNLKTAFAAAGTYEIELLSNAPSAVNAHEMIRSGMIDLYGHEYDMDIHAARAANTTVTLGNPIVLTVVTSTDVDELVIMEGRKTEVQPDSISCVDGENGQRTWTVTIATKTTGFKLYDIKGVGDFGITTETAKVVSVIVTKKAPFGQSPILVPFPVSVEK